MWYLTLLNGVKTLVQAITSSAGVSDANKIVATGGDGKIHSSFLPETGSTYTDEMAQDAVGGILADTSTIDLTYNDGANQITAAIVSGSISNSHIAPDAAIATSKIAGFDESVQDAVAAMLVQGDNITLTYNDAANTLTIAAAGGGGGADWDTVWNSPGQWDSLF